MKVGDEFEPNELLVTREFNQQYLEAQEDKHPMYSQQGASGVAVVHPGLLIAHSNVTRSPGFYLPAGVAAVHAKEEVQFLSPARVGKRLRVCWRVVDTYEKRGRPYQVKEAEVVDEDGVVVLRRRITDTYVTGKGVEDAASGR